MENKKNFANQITDVIKRIGNPSKNTDNTNIMMGGEGNEDLAKLIVTILKSLSTSNGDAPVALDAADGTGATVADPDAGAGTVAIDQKNNSNKSTPNAIKDPIETAIDIILILAGIQEKTLFTSIFSAIKKTTPNTQNTGLYVLDKDDANYKSIPNICVRDSTKISPTALDNNNKCLPNLNHKEAK